jgi:hypothetical protein
MKTPAVKETLVITAACLAMLALGNPQPGTDRCRERMTEWLPDDQFTRCAETHGALWARASDGAEYLLVTDHLFVRERAIWQLLATSN